MRHRDEHPIVRWLAAEARADDEHAERALAALFACLPRPRPAAAFADRVVARWLEARPGWLPLTAEQRRALPWVAATAVLAVLAVTLRLPALAAGAGVLSPGALLAALTTFFVTIAELLPEVALLGRLLVELQRASLLLIGSPPVLLTVALASFATACGYRWLRHHLAPSRTRYEAQIS
ncbi:MAG: hypothetical protein D6696_13595 [Acidobacteria bacterium]|nr:MAG: hypothetical protein D6696_13595 [Acidobacteriota bacterium]